MFCLKTIETETLPYICCFRPMKTINNSKIFNTLYSNNARKEVRHHATDLFYIRDDAGTMILQIRVVWT